MFLFLFVRADYIFLEINIRVGDTYLEIKLHLYYIYLEINIRVGDTFLEIMSIFVSIRSMVICVDWRLNI